MWGGDYRRRHTGGCRLLPAIGQLVCGRLHLQQRQQHLLVRLARHVGERRATVPERLQPESGRGRPDHCVLYRNRRMLRQFGRGIVGLQRVHCRRRGQPAPEEYGRCDALPRGMPQRKQLRRGWLQLCILRLLVRLLSHFLMGCFVPSGRRLVPAHKPLGGLQYIGRDAGGRHFRQGRAHAASLAAASLATAAVAPASAHDERADRLHGLRLKLHCEWRGREHC